ncbi:hypothetical protein [Protofrankia symbiont of Coriaria ruscifolia]|uniref:hypothetical protein n=1 Tax=Protofrankia symbiont of Coriaria ruscifolia TaxID=1306542 RepID=UPI0013EF8F75|nr:hypothetical protein [Protofrankia symbiont of Coriaria ruscifolia]
MTSTGTGTIRAPGLLVGLASLSYQEFFTFRANRPPTERAGGRSHRPEVPPGT